MRPVYLLSRSVPVILPSSVRSEYTQPYVGGGVVHLLSGNLPSQAGTISHQLEGFGGFVHFFSIGYLLPLRKCDLSYFVLPLKRSHPCSICCFHRIYCIQVSSRCHVFDYTGIVVLTVGSFYPCLYYGFFCEPLFQLVYTSFITLLGIGELS
jgi:adiponectin receptor